MYIYYTYVYVCIHTQFAREKLSEKCHAVTMSKMLAVLAFCLSVTNTSRYSGKKRTNIYWNLTSAEHNETGSCSF